MESSKTNASTATARKLIIIHGWGGTYQEAAYHLLDLLDIESFWQSGTIFINARQAPLIRHLLNATEQTPYTHALCKLIISRFMLSPPLPEDQMQAQQKFSRFSENRIKQAFPNLGIPMLPEARRKRAEMMEREAIAALEPVREVCRQVISLIEEADESRTEAYWRDMIHHRAKAVGLEHDMIPLLETLRDWQETGGDLDTVASAALYAWSLQQAAARENHPFRYGIEWQFAFLNYHEPLHSLVDLAPADVYLADLPIQAFPQLTQDIRELHTKGLHAARFEDHHPYSRQALQALEDLKTDGMLDFLALSGPLIGDELAEEDLKCAADMVFDSMVRQTQAETPGAQRLQNSAHQEDFVTPNRTKLGVLLTDLIKGGICKVELAQILVAAMQSDDAMERLDERGWARLPQLWQEQLNTTAEGILENAVTLKTKECTIVCALAVHAPPGAPKLPTGHAIRYLADHFPEAQYAFYIFGKSIMVARRLDQADTTLNLGSLMPAIGTESDGGHSGAAVCRPEANPHYPQRLLKSINSANFIAFCRYLSQRLDDAGHPVSRLKNRSQPAKSRWNSGRMKLLLVWAAAIIIGGVLMLLAPPFRPSNVRESNANFLPFISIDEGHESGEEPP